MKYVAFEFQRSVNWTTAKNRVFSLTGNGSDVGVMEGAGMLLSCFSLGDCAFKYMSVHINGCVSTNMYNCACRPA